jgi:uncharacterized SAM-binding protein YcdF (DUF218 family)
LAADGILTSVRKEKTSIWGVDNQVHSLRWSEVTNISRPTSLTLALRGIVGWWVAVILLLTVFVAGVWIDRAALLRGAADLWIVSDAITHADVVAVLGGGLDFRPFAAAEIYKKGLVTRVLVSQVTGGRSTEIGAVPGHTELNRMVLVKLGVPASIVEAFGQANRNTFDEAAALRRWADQHHVSRIIIPTEIFATRRLRWIIDQKFAGSSVKVDIFSINGPDYTREWWKTEAGIIAFQNELLKYLYYRTKY